MFTEIIKPTKNKIVIVALLAIVVLASFLRFYKLGEVPSSINWDEAAVGYNAWTVLHWGKDEWGKTLPLAFKSFGEYKLPVNIYLTIPSIALFDLTELGVRGSTALFGVFNVIIIFFLGREIFKSRIAGILASFFLAVSPYNLQFSRFNHELNFALFFFMLGIFLSLKAISGKARLLPVAFASFGLTLLTYNAAKIVVPMVVLTVCIVFYKEFWKIKKYFALAIFTLLIFVSLFVIDPNLLGGERFKQTSTLPKNLSSEEISPVITAYLSHFSNDFLFISGEGNPRHSIQTVGIFYKVDMIFLVLGILALILSIVKKKKTFIVLAVWALAAPLAASLGKEFPHSGRAMFMTGSFHLVAALGAFSLISLFKTNVLKFVGALVIVLAVSFYLRGYVSDYYGGWGDKYAIEWQYGMKQIAQYITRNPQYYKVYMTDVRHQPYIFFLYFMKVPLPVFLKSVQYEDTISSSYNLVKSFDNYQFGGWDTVESYPDPQILYVLEPANYTGLRHRLLFDVPLLVSYPNGTDAFYLVNGIEN